MSGEYKALCLGEEQLWLNDKRLSAGEALAAADFGMEEILAAEARLLRFAPLIARLFPETEANGGIIESPLTEINNMREALRIRGRLFIKRDSELDIAGSVKARGGIYEVLKHTEDVLAAEGLLSLLDMESEAEEHIKELRRVLSRCTVQVGSTGNLGLSIGIMSAALGYRAIVHMSCDAKSWKKAMLRGKGVEVIEYPGDYSAAVAKGREQSAVDPNSYFVDDENSQDLFMGYAVAALRLKKQLAAQGITVDEKHRLNVYLPCGVGGAPGGICFGLKCVFGDNARAFFAEPTQAPCMLAAFICGKPVAVTELGLSGKTAADGLAVGKGSALVYKAVKDMIEGEFTAEDERLAPYQRLLFKKEGLFIEPSSAIAFDAARYMGSGIPDDKDCLHVMWATGGRLVPADERARQLGYTEVVAALIWREGKFLICRRPPHKARGGLWEFPGGKIEPGETGEQALVRECREELGVTVEPISVFSELTHEYPDLTVRLTLFDARIKEGELTAIEHTELKFISASEIGEYVFCPADDEILRLLEADATDITKQLFALRDEAYAEFSLKLVPGMDAGRFIGVRIPQLRSFAKELYKSGGAEGFLSLLPHWYHDENMLHALLLNEEKDLEKLARDISSFLPYVDNWAVCDTLKPKLFKKRRAELWELIPSYLASEHTYTVRFGLGMLMAHFLDDDFSPEVLELAFEAAEKRPGSEYYIDMMAAWFFATALAKQYDAALPYIARLPQPVRGMTVRKACESFRVTEEQKAEVKERAKV